jgi:hypothetical protein
MNIQLAAIGWVSDAPPGHRLRWHYPLEALDTNGKYLGLPSKMIVERAPLDSRDLLAHPQASMGYPVQWWDQHGDIALASIVPLLVHPLPKPAQAVMFTWRGANARILFADAQRQIAERFAVDGDTVYVEASRIETIVVLEMHATLENLRTLDLFADRGLEWRPLAEITVAGTFAADFARIAPRYEIAPTITAINWTKLVELASDGTASTPAQAVPGNPTDWQSFELILGCRWEYALLGGFAFFDGPRTQTSDLDTLLDGVLHSPGNMLMAYRVRDADGRADISNLVLLPPTLAPSLNVPTTPVYDNPVAWLHRKRSSQSFLLGPGVTLKGGMLHFSPLTQFDGDYGVRCGMHWQQSDPRAIGVEIDEIVSASAIAGSPSRRRQFLNRTRRPEDVPPNVSLARSFDVDFPDVTLQGRGRAIDAWDRASGFSAWSPATPLKFEHEPEAPPLAIATYDAGAVRITRAVGVDGVPDWQPDAFVSKVGGQVFIYRQTTAARAVDATFGLPLPIDEGLYRVSVGGVANLADFVDGSFSIAGLTETIRAVVGTEIQFRADGASFMPGQARLIVDEGRSVSGGDASRRARVQRPAGFADRRRDGVVLRATRVLRTARPRGQRRAGASNCCGADRAAAVHRRVSRHRLLSSDDAQDHVHDAGELGPLQRLVGGRRRRGERPRPGRRERPLSRPGSADGRAPLRRHFVAHSPTRWTHGNDRRAASGRGWFAEQLHGGSGGDPAAALLGR